MAAESCNSESPQQQQQQTVSSPPPPLSQARPPPAWPAEDSQLLPADYEYDFVEEPPPDFFCSVSLELLLDPHQTDCCGHHFTAQVAQRLAGERKPCPMCKRSLATHPDKFHSRRVKEARVRCLYRETGGCGWEGELGNLRDHVAGCGKAPLKCRHCGRQGLREEEAGHNETCPQLPLPCPSGCEAGNMPRCRLEEHRSVCPCEVVSCPYSGLGCTKLLRRRELQRHLEEGEREHLLTMCAANLSLTRQLAQKMEEKDAEIARLHSRLSAMEEELKRTSNNLRESVSSKLSESEKTTMSEIKMSVSRLESSLTSSISSVQSSLVLIQRQLDSAPCSVAPLEFIVTNFEALRAHQLEWRSPAFHTHQGGYKMCLGISPYGVLRGFGTHVSLHLYKMLDSHAHQLPWDVQIRLCIHVQNQTTGTWEREYENTSVRSKPEDVWEVSRSEYTYIRHAELQHYVRNNQMRVRVTALDISPPQPRRGVEKI